MENKTENPDFMSFIRGFFKRKVRNNIIVAVICLIAIAGISINKIYKHPREFSTYEDLETLYKKGTKYVTIDSDSIKPIKLDNIGGFSYSSTSLDCGIIDVSGDTVLVYVEDDSLYKNIVYYINKNDYIQDKIDKAIDELKELPERYDYFAYDPSLGSLYDNDFKSYFESYYGVDVDYYVTSNLQELESIKPLILTTADLTIFNNVSNIFLCIFAIVLVFCIFELSKNSKIFISPERSKTYRILSQYGNPKSILEKCNESFKKYKKTLKPGYIVANKDFIIFPYSSYVYIAPLKELLWGYISFHVKRMYKTTSTYYTVNLCFTTEEEKRIRLLNKEEGKKILKDIKEMNANVLIGFNHDLLNMFQNDFGNFKNEVLLNIDKWQKKTSASEQADVNSYFWGLDQEYKE